ncbi:type III secretion system protein SctP [Trinickia dinghuensis]|uniref:Type III secretion protein HpaP n=1 Tax=Trinickia dinghuensis TaxID=2291023 RepID=A0A3D8JVX7_9BURK|nr:type III secretion system protein SctP [Trinickia dinghuensis]RDU96754.1 hypothetical protein DWV00_22445 [Trinickia dinghuensis]
MDGISPRIIAPSLPADDEAEPMPAPAPRSVRRGFDYAALVRRAHRRAQAAQTSARTEQDPRRATDRRDDADPLDAPPPSAADEPEETLETDPEHRTDETDPAARRHADALAMPFVATLAAQQAHMAQLMHFLANRIADFCSDRAIVASGHWSARLPLDDKLLPECVLHLTLSHFELALRFEARDPAVRRLICAHQAVLERQLETLLDTLDCPRDVSVEA